MGVLRTRAMMYCLKALFLHYIIIRKRALLGPTLLLQSAKQPWNLPNVSSYFNAIAELSKLTGCKQNNGPERDSFEAIFETEFWEKYVWNWNASKVDMVYVYIWKFLPPCISLPRFWHILFHSWGPFRAWNKVFSIERQKGLLLLNCKADETCCVNVCLRVFSSIFTQALHGLLQFLTSKESHLRKLLPTAGNSLYFFSLPAFPTRNRKACLTSFQFCKEPFCWCPELEDS